MKTIYDAKDRLISFLIWNMKPFISGGIYRDRRPTGSTKEDIVVNSLPLSSGFHQKGVFNVNLYVPNVKVNFEGVQQYHPNHFRLRELARPLSDALEEYHGGDFNLWTEYMQEYEEDTEKATYLNFRVKFNLFN